MNWMNCPSARRLAPVLAALGVAGGCAASEDIVLALEGPLTGDQASNGQDMLRGVQLAVDQLNATGGGALGRNVVVLEVDDQADPEQAVAVAESAINSGAVAVVGPYNSGVGVKNLQTYLDAAVVPVHLTSSDDTTGIGVTIQPKNSQISPPEVAWILGRRPARVSMLVDPSAFTRSMADNLKAALGADGVTVVDIAIVAGASDYSDAVANALATSPDLLYVSTYFPEGALIARALNATADAADTTCFMGLANQDPGFVDEAGIPDSKRCVFSGVPTPDEFPTAANYLKAYGEKFPDETPGVWGAFTYDSARILFDAWKATGTTEASPVLDHLRQLDSWPGATGPITIDPDTGNRSDVPVKILNVNDDGKFVVLE